MDQQIFFNIGLFILGFFVARFIFFRYISKAQEKQAFMKEYLTILNDPAYRTPRKDQ